MSRITRYGSPHAVRFKKEIEKEIILICTRKEITVSEFIQEAVHNHVKKYKKGE